MQLTPLLPVSTMAPATAQGASLVPVPPTRWTRWYTNPIATVEYGAGSRMQLWHEARIPADRSLTGSRKPIVRFGGATREAAIAAAHALAQTPAAVEFSFANGRVGTTQVHPAIAVLHDAKAGVFWLTQLQTTVRLRGEWIDAPHSIDGAAFEGAAPMLRTPTIRAATRELVAVVGRDAVIRPSAWRQGAMQVDIDD